MTQYLHNKHIFLDRRRELRRKQTDAEARLWHRLRGRRLLGHKFYRQYDAGPYILDFYCFDSKLAIELDGGQHAAPEQVEYDAARTEFLRGLGINVMRFWNDDVLNDTEAVLAAISSILTLPSLSERDCL